MGVESYTDKDGNLCIPSGQDVSVSLFMINPYHYKLGSNDVSDPDLSSLGYQQPGPYIISELVGEACSMIKQDDEDTTLLHFNYGREYLENHDGGGEIGGLVKVQHPYNPETKDFAFSLKCNSKPPRPLNPTVMLTDTSENGEFVLCLNLG